MGIRVVVSGAYGKVGREVVKAVLAHPGLELVGVVGHKHGIGQDIGTLIGIQPTGLCLSADLAATVLESRADVVVDFTRPDVVKDNLRIIAESNAHAVIGTTGIKETDIPEIGALYRRHSVNVLICPNFAVGAVLLLRFAQQAARFFPHVEILETHHDQKRDAPSGTAIKYAEAISKAVDQDTVIPAGTETIPNVRGGDAAGIRIHSLRLPGFVAHHSIVFGGLGQSLTLTHDSISRESFVPGVLLAIEKIQQINGIIYGLEHLLEI